MKRILLLMSILLVGCSPLEQVDELEFPNSSYGKTMRCLNDNYFDFYPEMTGEKNDDLIERVFRHCINKFEEDIVDTSVYSGGATLYSTSTLSVDVEPKSSEHVINYMLTNMRFEVTLKAKYLNLDDECEDRELSFFGSAQSDGNKPRSPN